MSITIPIRVLSVCTSDVAGGAARAAFRIHESVRQEGIDSQMFVKQKGSNDLNVHALAEYAPQNGFHNILDWVAQKIKNKWQHVLWRPYRQTMDGKYKSDLRGTRIYGALQAWDYDVLHLHWINNRFIKIEDLPTDKPIVWTLHDSWPFCGVCHYFLDCVGYQQQCGTCFQLGSRDVNDLSHRIWKKKKTIFDTLDLHIVSPSRWLAECAAKSSLFRGRDIHVIPNCLDTDVFRPLLPSDIETNLSAAQRQNMAVNCVFRAAVDGKVSLLYGAANAVKDGIKGFSLLLSALQILDKKGLEANLMVFGAEETELPMRFEHISVTFLGYVSDTDLLVALYNMADVMVVPSLTENLSCAIMEALSCGTPVCCFNIGGNGDMVEHRLNGYLAVEKDCADLANGIQECIAHSKEWGTMARDSVVRKYAMEVVAKQYVELYKELAYKYFSAKKNTR